MITKRPLDKDYPIDFVPTFMSKADGTETLDAIKCSNLDTALLLANKYILAESDTYDSYSLWLTSFEIRCGDTAIEFYPTVTTEGKTSQSGTLLIWIGNSELNKIQKLKLHIPCFRDIEPILKAADFNPDEEEFFFYEFKEQIGIPYDELIWQQEAKVDDNHYDKEFAALNNDILELTKTAHDVDDTDRLDDMKRRYELFKDVLAYKYMLMRGWRMGTDMRWTKNTESK